MGVRIITDQDLPNHKFDFINTDQVFEHLNYPLETFTTLIKSLNTGGVLKISVPSPRSPPKNFSMIDWDNKNSFTAISPLQHIQAYPHSVFEALAKKFDLQITNPVFMVKKHTSYTILRAAKRYFKQNPGYVWFMKR